MIFVNIAELLLLFLELYLMKITDHYIKKPLL